MLPRNLRPIRLSRRIEPFDSDQFVFESKVDGFRALAHIESVFARDGLASARAIGWNQGEENRFVLNPRKFEVRGEASSVFRRDPQFRIPADAFLLKVDDATKEAEYVAAWKVIAGTSGCIMGSLFAADVGAHLRKYIKIK